MRWTENVACVGEWRGVYRVLVRKSEGNKPPGDPGVHGKIILKLIFRKWNVKAWIRLSWLRIGTGGEHV
jgi:hypothetical protein